jgi:hypothetical protein
MLNISHASLEHLWRSHQPISENARKCPFIYEQRLKELSFPAPCP